MAFCSEQLSTAELLAHGGAAYVAGSNRAWKKRRYFGS